MSLLLLLLEETVCGTYITLVPESSRRLTENRESQSEDKSPTGMSLWAHSTCWISSIIILHTLQTYHCHIISSSSAGAAAKEAALYLANNNSNQSQPPHINTKDRIWLLLYYYYYHRNLSSIYLLLFPNSHLVQLKSNLWHSHPRVAEAAEVASTPQ